MYFYLFNLEVYMFFSLARFVIPTFLLLVLCLPGCNDSGSGGPAVGLVIDAAGINDKSFNAAAWEGAQRAADELDADASFRLPEDGSFAANIAYYADAGADLTVGVGTLLQGELAESARANPGLNYALVDGSYDPVMDNVLGLTFAADQAAYLAGYLAAGVSRTGVVAVFGGMDLTPVAAIMDGFARGVARYNQVHGDSVQTLGWNADTQTGTFLDSFDDAEAGQAAAEVFIAQSADVILPVAASAGHGAAWAAKAAGGVSVIGVDTDWTVVLPEYADVILTSVLKDIADAVYMAIQKVDAGTFAGGTWKGTLANGGVGLAPYAGAAHQVSQALQEELDNIAAEVISSGL